MNVHRRWHAGCYVLDILHVKKDLRHKCETLIYHCYRYHQQNRNPMIKTVETAKVVSCGS